MIINDHKCPKNPIVLQVCWRSVVRSTRATPWRLCWPPKPSKLRWASWWRTSPGRSVVRCLLLKKKKKKKTMEKIDMIFYDSKVVFKFRYWLLLKCWCCLFQILWKNKIWVWFSMPRVKRWLCWCARTRKTGWNWISWSLGQVVSGVEYCWR